MLPNLKLSYYNFFIPHPKRELYIVYNSFMNSMISLDWNDGLILSKLNSMEIHYLDIELIELLRENGMIIENHIDEFEQVRTRANKSRDKAEKISTLFLVLAPTNTCNMNCPYCYQGDKNPKGNDSKQITEENINALKELVLKTIKEPHSVPIKKISIEWFGGEPLIKKQLIYDFSQFLLSLKDEFNLDYNASIITNGTLLDEKTWELLYQCQIKDIQITIDGQKDMHDSMRTYISGKGTYEKILENLSIMPKGKFEVVLRINGDKKVFEGLPYMFDDLIERGIWPSKSISFHWAPKFYNFIGFNQDKEVYYTSYEYQKSREDFALLRIKKYNERAKDTSFTPRNLRIGYPSLADFYCNTVESPNSLSIDGGGYVHKCYNTINNSDRRIQHITEFDPNAKGMDHYKKFDKTRQADCRTCKVLPICEENCNMRFVDNAESKICSGWKYFMDERMIQIYEQNFVEENKNVKLFSKDRQIHV